MSDVYPTRDELFVYLNSIDDEAMVGEQLTKATDLTAACIRGMSAALKPSVEILQVLKEASEFIATLSGLTLRQTLKSIDGKRVALEVRDSELFEAQQRHRAEKLKALLAAEKRSDKRQAEIMAMFIDPQPGEIEEFGEPLAAAMLRNWFVTHPQFNVAGFRTTVDEVLQHVFRLDVTTLEEEHRIAAQMSVGQSLIELGFTQAIFGSGPFVLPEPLAAEHKDSARDHSGWFIAPEDAVTYRDGKRVED